MQTLLLSLDHLRFTLYLTMNVHGTWSSESMFLGWYYETGHARVVKSILNSGNLDKIQGHLLIGSIVPFFLGNDKELSCHT